MMDMMIESEFQTRKGTPVHRFKGLVGKSIGGQLYIHRNYAAEIIPTDVIEYGEDILKRFDPRFEYNCIMLDVRRDVIRFDEAPDFDTAREPHVGNYIVIDLKGEKPPYKGYSNSIWHHKWLWVRDNYKGFDVDKAKQWSKLWLSKLDEPAKGTDASWKPQLMKHGLTEGVRLDYINNKIRKLRDEWDVLDGQGTGFNRQQEISQEIDKLQKEKEQWDRMYFAINEAHKLLRLKSWF